MQRWALFNYKNILPNGPSGRSTRGLGGGCVYPKSKILFSFGYLLVSFVYSKAFHLWLRIIFHLSLYLYPKVVFIYIGRSIRFREQRARRNQPSPSDDRGFFSWSSLATEGYGGVTGILLGPV